MGQYYKIVILAEKHVPITDEPVIDEPAEIIRLALNPHDYQQGAKITEHSYIGNQFVGIAEYLLSPLGMFYKSRVVWAGDYADTEPQTRQNLYHMVREPQLLFNCSKDFHCEEYRYIVNHTKREFVDKLRCLEQQQIDDDCDLVVHPLPLLVSEGNGRGGGDYSGPGEEDCGRWARDIISMGRTRPTQEKGYTELITRFQPN
jgi:hypothetical protein